MKYDNCQKAENDLDYQLLWTLKSSELLNSGSSKLLVGLDAAQSNGWIGFGIPETPDVMIGANAVLINTASSSETGMY
jgi:hypothetical protein